MDHVCVSLWSIFYDNWSLWMCSRLYLHIWIMCWIQYHPYLFFLSSLTFFFFSSPHWRFHFIFIYHVMLSTGTLGIQTYLVIWYPNLENLNIFNTCKCIFIDLLSPAIDASLFIMQLLFCKCRICLTYAFSFSLSVLQCATPYFAAYSPTGHS